MNYPFKKIHWNEICIRVDHNFLVIYSLTFTSLFGPLPCTPVNHLHFCVYLLGWSSWLRVPVPAGIYGKTLWSAAEQVCKLPVSKWRTVPFASHGLWVRVSVRIHWNQLWGEGNYFICTQRTFFFSVAHFLSHSPTLSVGAGGSMQSKPVSEWRPVSVSAGRFLLRLHRWIWGENMQSATRPLQDQHLPRYTKDLTKAWSNLCYDVPVAQVVEHSAGNNKIMFVFFFYDFFFFTSYALF